MHVSHLWLRDFRSYEEFDCTLGTGTTAVIGDNGNGKTNLVEAITLLSRLRSFRGAPTDALVRVGAESAVVRATVEDGGREVLIEIELPRRGRPRVQVNRQRVARSRDLLDALAVTVFAPDDLELVKGGPAERREFLDELLVTLHPKNEVACEEFAKVLRQRNALLKQLGGRLDESAALTLDVWDLKLAEAGERLAGLRRRVVAQLRPYVTDAHEVITGRPTPVDLDYESDWQAGALAAALEAGRADDVRRGVSLVGPHRDELGIRLGGLPTRTHASQGEQRSLALSLRLAAHRLATDALGRPPVLILDDVFSELDDRRSTALLAGVPAGQTIVTSATALPAAACPDVVLQLENSRIVGPGAGPGDG